MTKPRYKSPLLPQGVTREAIPWLGPDKQRSAIVAWIAANFELRRPEHIVFSDREIDDVYEQVEDEFTDVPVHVVESALSDAASLGEWVRKRTPRQPDVRLDPERLAELAEELSTSAPSLLNTPRELQERAGLATVVKELSDRIAEIEAKLDLRGHNGGPLDETTQQGQFIRIRNEVRAIGIQMSSNSPTPVTVAHSALALENIAEANGWFGEHQEIATKAYAKAFGATLGKDHAHLVSILLGGLVMLLLVMLSQAVDWLNVVVG